MRNRWLAAAALVAALCGFSLPLQAQERIPAFDIGVYGGGAWSSSWFGINDEYTGFVGLGEDDDARDQGFGIGLAPIFGATANWYFTPKLGLRLHGAYMPSDFPTGDDDMDVAAYGALGPAVVSVNAFGEDDYNYPLNNWLADAGLVLRPYAESRGDWLGSTYFFLTGGVLISDVSGDADPGDVANDDCVDAYQSLGACLNYNPNKATVGQGSVGFGLNLFPLTSRLGLFTELAVHGYDSPVHTPDEEDAIFTSSLAEDRIAFSPRAVVGLKLSLGDLRPAPVIVPAPLPPAPAPAPAPEERAIAVCVVENGALRNVNAAFRPSLGDTMVTVNGQRRAFSDAYPATGAGYAAGAGWYLNSDQLRFQNREYVKYGVPRLVAETSQLTRIGEHEGVTVFSEAGATQPATVLYVPLRPGCEFQPYQLREQLRPRG